MVGLGEVEGLVSLNGGGRSCEAGGLHGVAVGGDGRQGAHLLPVVAGHHEGSVLRSVVVTLAVQLARVVRLEEGRQQRLVGDLPWVEVDQHRLGVVGAA